MNKKQVALAFGLGALLGYLAKQQMELYQKITPEKALKLAKETFKQNGPIHGSWIYMKPEEIERNGLFYHVYRGGITRLENDIHKQYEFYVDTDTGALIDSVKTA
jgi:predicted small secreted protein